MGLLLFLQGPDLGLGALTLLLELRLMARLGLTELHCELVICLMTILRGLLLRLLQLATELHFVLVYRGDLLAQILGLFLCLVSLPLCCGSLAGRLLLG